MFERIKTWFKLIVISMKFIKRDGELFVYSLLSFLAGLAVLVTFIWADYLFFGNFEALLNENTTETGREAIMWAMTFLYYLVFAFIAFFFNAAIITSVQRRLEGKDNTIGDGFRGAMASIKQIFVWSVISATVSLILKALQQKFGEDSFIGSLIISMIGWAWNILTFFSFPLMVLENKGPKDAIKESGKLFKDTWGERATVSLGMGLFFFFAYVAVLVLWAFLIINSSFLGWFLIIFLGIVILAIVSGTCTTIIKVVLLHYIKTWELPDELKDENGELLNITVDKKA